MSTRTLEGWSSHKHLNKQILSLFQRQWGKILGDWCKKPFVLVLAVKCQELGDDDHRWNLLGSQLGHLGLQHPDHHVRLPVRNLFDGKPLWQQPKMIWQEKKSPETTLAVGGVARIKPSPANSALPSALVVVVVEILSVPPPHPAVQKGSDLERFLWHLNISNRFSETKRS